MSDEPKLPTFPPGTLKMLKPIQQERDGYFDVEYRFVTTSDITPEGIELAAELAVKAARAKGKGRF